jgi:hypothetical protein
MKTLKKVEMIVGWQSFVLKIVEFASTARLASRFLAKSSSMVRCAHEPLCRRTFAGLCATWRTVYADPHKHLGHGAGGNTHQAQINSIFASRI